MVLTGQVRMETILFINQKIIIIYYSDIRKGTKLFGRSASYTYLSLVQGVSSIKTRRF